MEQLVRKAKELFEDGTTAFIIGYASVSGTRRLHPFIAENAQDAERLTFNHFALNNLSVYLNMVDRSKPGKTGIIVKGCDVRSVLNSIRENNIRREDVLIIGLKCDGVAADYMKQWRNDNIAEKCADCPVRVPNFVDILITADDKAEINADKLVA